MTICRMSYYRAMAIVSSLSSKQNNDMMVPGMVGFHVCSVYSQLLRKTRSDSVATGLRNGILIKNWVRNGVDYVVIDCIGWIIPWVVAGYPMVEVFFVRV